MSEEGNGHLGGKSGMMLLLIKHRQERIDAGTRTEAQVEAMRDKGSFPFLNKTTEEMATIEASQMCAAVEGTPQILSDHDVWDSNLGALHFPVLLNPHVKGLPSLDA